MKIKLRRGTAAQWAAKNPVLAAGEPGFETDTKVSKVGDGATAWTSLASVLTSAGGTVAALTVTGALSAGSVASTGALSVGGNLSHTGTGVGFYGTAAAAKPTVTGSRGGNAALASLLTALASLGLITDSTTV